MTTQWPIECASSEVRIDGSAGEGGGQVLRSSLTLSLLTGRPVTIEAVRGGRKRGGLLRQHLRAAELAARISRAETRGIELGSRHLEFRPRTLQSGRYQVAVGSAGSTTLILQTVLLPLLHAEGNSSLEFSGGTHNPMAPCFEYIERCYLPQLRRMGGEVAAQLHEYGFFPAGGGKMSVDIKGGARLSGIQLDDPAQFSQPKATVYISQLERSIAERERDTLIRKLAGEVTPEIVHVDSRGPGNLVCIEVDAGDNREIMTSFGEVGVTAERVARAAATQTRNYLRVGAPVGPYLADQLLLPMALAGSGSFLTSALSLHARTNISVIESFLGPTFEVDEIGPQVRVAVSVKD